MSWLHSSTEVRKKSFHPRIFFLYQNGGKFNPIRVWRRSNPSASLLRKDFAAGCCVNKCHIHTSTASCLLDWEWQWIIFIVLKLLLCLCPELHELNILGDVENLWVPLRHETDAKLLSSVRVEAVLSVQSSRALGSLRHIRDF